MNKRTVVGLGELLWDMFPAGKQLGGAPANFAYISSLLGDRGVVASRVGQDDPGREAIACVKGLGLETSEIQTDPVHPTGTVEVTVDGAGQPKFEIKQSVAWDFLEWPSKWGTLARECDAVCFGSLAQRAPQSRETIQAFLQAARTKSAAAVCVFDVNLRQSFHSAELLSGSARYAHIMKLNHEELPVVTKLFGYESPDEKTAARWLQRKFNLSLVCVTRGARGSLMMSESEETEHPGFQVKVADTVGAGDAFTAALVHHFLRGASLAEMSEAANQLGSWVASQVGAMPVPDQTRLEKLRAAGR
ncbi:MAG TPA: carbohydrate kinase [Candidatus Acidoferrum sp.]|nr:carbohydrate kinase [Candidatus Acidoferrum sp.]